MFPKYLWVSDNYVFVTRYNHVLACEIYLFVVIFVYEIKFLWKLVI